MSEESVEEVKEELESPIQDALEHVYTELGFALAKRAKNAGDPSRGWTTPLDHANDIGRFAEALKNLAEVHNW